MSLLLLLYCDLSIIKLSTLVKGNVNHVLLSFASNLKVLDIAYSGEVGRVEYEGKEKVSEEGIGFYFSCLACYYLLC